MIEEKRSTYKMVELLCSLNLEELKALRPLLLKEVEKLGGGDALQQCSNKLIDLLIHGKQTEMREEYAENDSCAC
ncbi:hypothetical protein [Lacrimispora indolis]|uniref:hypothetical protein n=1 Tax=Lacrimispora indolis TaxID=69825 RepID=UPI00045E5D2D|nr:hypothetical protein [Lacrimispora indolis]